MGVGHLALPKMQDCHLTLLWEKNIPSRNVRQAPTPSRYQEPLLTTSLHIFCHLSIQFTKYSNRWNNRGTITPKNKIWESNSSNVKCSRPIVHQLQAWSSTALINRAALKIWTQFSRHISHDNGICYLVWTYMDIPCRQPSIGEEKRVFDIILNLLN